MPPSNWLSFAAVGRCLTAPDLAPKRGLRLTLTLI